MTWRPIVVNNSTNTVIHENNYYSQGGCAVIAITGVGSIFLLDIGAVSGGPHTWAVRVTTGNTFNQLWWYDGTGECTVTINADNTFTLTGQGQTLTSPIGPPYLPVVTFPGRCLVSVNAFTNASYLQRLILTVADDQGNKQWSGSGEGNVAIATNSQFMPPGADGTTVQAAVSIDYSTDGGATWAHSNISPPSQCAVRRFNQAILVSEDAVDNDWNDMTALFSWWSAS